MKAAQRNAVATLVVLLSGVAATGCGQKGQLTLPDAQRSHRRVPVRSPVPPSAPSAPAAPADPPPAPR